MPSCERVGNIDLTEAATNVVGAFEDEKTFGAWMEHQNNCMLSVEFVVFGKSNFVY